MMEYRHSLRRRTCSCFFRSLVAWACLLTSLVSAQGEPPAPTIAPSPRPSSDWITKIVRVEFVFESMRDILSGSPSLDFQEITMQHIQTRMDQYPEVQANLIDGWSVAADIADQTLLDRNDGSEFQPLRIFVAILLRYKTFDPDHQKEDVAVNWVGSTFASPTDQDAYISSIYLSNPDVYDGLQTMGSVLVEGKPPVERTDTPNVSPRTPTPTLEPTTAAAPSLQSGFVDVAFRLISTAGILEGMALVDFEQVTAQYSQEALQGRGDLNRVRVALTVQDQFSEEANRSRRLRELQQQVYPLVVTTKMMMEYRYEGKGSPEKWIQELFDEKLEKDAYLSKLQQENPNVFLSVESIQVFVGTDNIPSPPPELQSVLITVAVRLTSTRQVLEGSSLTDFESATTEFIQAAMEVRVDVSDVWISFERILDQFLEAETSSKGRILQELRPVVIQAQMLVEYRNDGDKSQDVEQWIRQAFDSDEKEQKYVARLKEENPGAFEFVEHAEVLFGKYIPTRSPPELQNSFLSFAVRLVSVADEMISKALNDFKEVTVGHVQSSLENVDGLSDVRIALDVEDQFFDGRAKGVRIMRFLQDEQPLVVSARMIVEYRSSSEIESSLDEWVEDAFDSQAERSAFIALLQEANFDTFQSVKSVEVLFGDEIPSRPPLELQTFFIDIAVRLVSTRGVLNDMAKIDFQTATGAHVMQVMDINDDVSDARVAANIVDQFIDNGNAFSGRMLQLEDVKPLVVTTRLLVEHRSDADGENSDPEAWVEGAFDNEAMRTSYIERLQQENLEAFQYVESVEVLVGEDVPSSAIPRSASIAIKMRLINTRTTLRGKPATDFQEVISAHVQGSIEGRREGLQDLGVETTIADQVVIFDLDNGGTALAVRSFPGGRNLQSVRPLEITVDIDATYRSVLDVPLQEWIAGAFDSTDALNTLIDLLKTLDPDTFGSLDRIEIVSGVDGGARDSQRGTDLSGDDGGNLGVIIGVTISGAVLIALASLYVSRRTRESKEWDDHPASEGSEEDKETLEQPRLDSSDEEVDVEVLSNNEI